MSYEEKMGFDMKLLYHIKKIEEVLGDNNISIIIKLWYDGYDNETIIKDKYTIYEGIAQYLLEEQPNKKEENLIIKSVQILFNYFDSKMIINKLTNVNDNSKEIFEYNIEYLKTPKWALIYLQIQQQGLAC
jgi:hypothetical protein